MINKWNSFLSTNLTFEVTKMFHSLLQIYLEQTISSLSVQILQCSGLKYYIQNIRELKLNLSLFLCRHVSPVPGAPRIWRSASDVELLQHTIQLTATTATATTPSTTSHRARFPAWYGHGDGQLRDVS